MTLKRIETLVISKEQINQNPDINIFKAEKKKRRKIHYNSIIQSPLIKGTIGTLDHRKCTVFATNLTERIKGKQQFKIRESNQWFSYFKSIIVAINDENTKHKIDQETKTHNAQ